MNRFCVCASAALLALSIAIPLVAQPASDTIVLTINDKPVYYWEIGVAIPQVQTELAGRGMQNDRQAVIQTAMRRVIDIRLLGQEARRKSLEPDSARVASTMAELETQAGGREGFAEALKGIGVTYDQLKSNISEADLVQVLISTTIDPQVTVTAEEVETFYQENPEKFAQPEMVHARHILIRITQGADQAEKDSARARATAALQQVKAGEEFATVAKEVSDGPNAPEGGDLGVFPRESMVPVLTDAAFALDIGEISPVLESQFGFHLVEVEEKRAAGKMPYSEAKIRIELMLKETKAGEKVSQLLVKLNEEATIVEVPPPGSAPSGTGGG